MYFLYLTLNTLNGRIAVGSVLYILALAILCPILRRKNKYGVVRILALVPMVVAMVHFAVYRRELFFHFKSLYIVMLTPLIFLFLAKKTYMKIGQTLLAITLGLYMFFTFTLDSLNRPLMHNYSNLSYTESFTRTLDTLEKEHCLNSWKNIDYDYLYKEYYPRVVEAEQNNDKEGFLSIMYELAYRFYDGHTRIRCKDLVLAQEYDKNHFGYDYGFSMVQVEDGDIVAVVVEPSSDAGKAGIHEGTVILKWDNQEIHEACSRVECISDAIQYPVKENEDVYRPLFLACQGGEYIDITFRNDDGEEQVVTAHKENYGWEYPYRFAQAFYSLNRPILKYQNFDFFMLDDRCGYIRITDEVFDKVKDNIAALNQGYYPRLTERYASLYSQVFFPLK